MPRRIPPNKLCHRSDIDVIAKVRSLPVFQPEVDANVYPRPRADARIWADHDSAPVVQPQPRPAGIGWYGEAKVNRQKAEINHHDRPTDPNDRVLAPVCELFNAPEDAQEMYRRITQPHPQSPPGQSGTIQIGFSPRAKVIFGTYSGR